MSNKVRITCDAFDSITMLNSGLDTKGEAAALMTIHREVTERLKMLAYLISDDYQMAQAAVKVVPGYDEVEVGKAVGEVIVLATGGSAA